MDDLNELLRYWLKYIYNVEVQAESFYHRLQKNVKTRELVDQAARLEKISATNRRKIDKMCRNCFLDPRGFYSKSMMGFVEDAEILLQSSFMPEVKETALKRDLQNHPVSKRAIWPLARTGAGTEVV